MFILVKWLPVPLVIFATGDSEVKSLLLSGLPPVFLRLPFESTFHATMVTASL